MRISKKILAIALSILMAVSMIPFTVFADTKPTATVSEVPISTVEQYFPGSGLDVAYKFVANNDGDDVYKTYYADFTVSFDKAIKKDDVELWGQYGTYPLTEAPITRDLAANEEYRLLKDALGWPMTYQEILDQVGTFYCGAKFTAASAGATMTLKLAIYETQEVGGDIVETGTEVQIDNAAQTFTAPELPQAVITEITNDATLNTLGLDKAYMFESDGQPSAYDDEYCDFVVSFDQDITSDDIELWGKYGAYDWTNLASETSSGKITYEAGKDYYLLRDIIKWPMTYEQIRQIGVFYCGLNAKVTGAGVTTNVDLALYEEPEDDTEEIAVATVGETKEYTAPALPQAVITEITNDATLNTLGLDRAYMFESDGQPSAYDDEYCDFIVSFDQDVTSDDIELWGKYGSYDWTNIASEASGGSVTYEAGKNYYLLRDIVKWPMTYGQIRQIGVFYCGLNAKVTAAGVTTNVELALYEEPAVGEEPAPAQVGETKEYTAPALPAAVITDITNEPENTLGLDAAYKFEAPAGETTNAYDDEYCDFVVRFDQDVTSDDLELWGKYGAYDWTNIASEASGGSVTYEANKDYYLLRDIVKWPMTYGQIREIGTFLCGVKSYYGANGVTMDVDLVLYEEPAVGEEPAPAKIDDEQFIAPDKPAPAAEDVVSITTADEIDVNLYLADTGEEYTVEYTFNTTPEEETDVQHTTTVSFASLPLESGKRRLTITVAPAQIKDNIDIVIKNANGGVVRYYENYSVAEYCDQIIAGNYAENVKTLAKTVLDYGKAASDFFGYNVNKYANQAYNNNDPFDFSSVNLTASATGITINEVRYVAKSVPDLRFAVDMTEEDAALLTAETDKGYDASFVKVEGAVVLQVTGIPAAKLDEAITITVSNGATITYTPIAYAKVAATTSNNPKLAKLGNAIAYYWQAAKAVFA